MTARDPGFAFDTARPAGERAPSRWLLLKDSLRLWLGRTLNKCGVPGLVRETIIPDEITGQIIQISYNSLYTVISIDGRDYYFNRFDGRFGGTGMGTSCDYPTR